MTPARRTLLLFIGIALGLSALWQRWTPQTGSGDAPPPVRTKAQTHSPTTPPVRLLPPTTSEFASGDSQALAPLSEDGTPIGWVRFSAEDISGQPVDTWYVRSPDCDLFYSSRLPDEPRGLAPGLCRFEGIRIDGPLATNASPVVAEIVEDTRLDIVLVFPEMEQAGLGMEIAEHDEGLEIMAVFPDTPADDLGLRAGDLILEIDGLDAATLPLDELVEEISGPEGTEIALAVAWEGDTGWVVEDLTTVRESSNAPPATNWNDPRIGFIERANTRLFGN